MAGGTIEKSLEQTPTWAVASVCTVFVVCSVLVERGIFSFGRVSNIILLFLLTKSCNLTLFRLIISLPDYFNPQLFSCGSLLLVGAYTCGQSIATNRLVPGGISLCSI